MTTSEQTGGAADAPVLTERRGACGIITLNRPRAINALSLEMVHLASDALRAWESEDATRAVVLRGAGERGFCSGGDVRRQRELALGSDDDHAMAVRFWADEYELDGAIASYPKPVMAFMDGITMGGGLGLAGHASMRVVTPTSRIAMPEMAIGFFPDVGATHLLAQAPGELGTHLALTGQAIGAADAIHAGLADVYIDTDADPGALAALVGRLVEGDVAWAERGVQADIGDDPGVAHLAAAAHWIDRCYAGSDPVAIVAALRGVSDPEATAAADAIEARSPLAVHIALRALRQARELGDLDSVLRRDTALARWFTDEAEFHEGVRAQLVDKDRNPRWRHAGLADVRREEVDAAFAG